MKRLSIRWRLMLIFAMILIPISGVILVSQESFYRIMKDQTSRYTAQYIEKISYDIAYTLSELEKAAMPLLQDEAIAHALQNGQSETAQARLNQVLRNASLTPEMGSAVLLLDRSQRVLASTYDEWTGRLRVLGAQWLNKIISAGGERVLISGYSITKGSDLKPAKVISMARGLYSQGTLTGYVMVEVPVQVITQICAGVSLGNKGFVALVDSDNYVIFNTKEEAIGSKFMTISPPVSGQIYHEETLMGVPMLVVEVQGQVPGLRVVGAIPRSELEGELTALRQSTTLAVAVIAFAMLVLVAVVTTRISQPIVKLCGAMKQVEAGDFQASIPVTREDEIGRLQAGFNHMVRQVDELIAKEYKTAIRERDAQLNEMMAIINPHFIYNTLEAISMTAYLHGDEKTVDMIGRLGDIFHALTGMEGSRFLTLRQELDTVENYLALLNVRADGQIHVHWQVDEKLLEAKVMKFTLQPIVENSVLHGFRDKAGGNIWITIQETPRGDVGITLEDDGRGVDTQTLERIRGVLYLGQSPGARPMALQNVHERLQLAFGPAYGVGIANREGGGLRVTLEVPVDRAGPWEGGDEHEHRDHCG